MLNKAETPVVAMQAPQKLSKYKPVWLKWAAAAVFVGCMISGAVIFNQHAHQGETTAKDDIVTTRGTKSKIILPDGTKVWLNADTRLHFDKEFNGVLREVYLDGEAFSMLQKIRTALLSCILPTLIYGYWALLLT